MSFARTLTMLAILMPMLVSESSQAGPRPKLKVGAPQGVVLTGGTIVLDFADGQQGFETANLNRLDQLTWSGGNGMVAGQNFLDETIDFEGDSDPENMFGGSYGVATSGSPPEPRTVANGYAAVASNQSATTLTATTTGSDYQGNATNEPIVSTNYTVFPAGDPNDNEFRVSRTINFTSTTPIYPTSGVQVYVPYLSSRYFIVNYPNAAGVIQSLDNNSCDLVCVITDWNGKWFAEDDDSGTGMVVFRDSASQMPAELVVAFEDESLNNLTAIAVLQPVGGFKAPLTEIEWLCFYDPSTWTNADRQAGNLPKGCAQKNAVTPVTPAPSVTIALNPSSVAVGQTATLTWSTSNATACTASGAWSGTEPISGSAAEAPASAGSYTYTLACTGAGGSTTSSATLTINAAPTISFSAASSSVTVGQADTLNWSSTNTTACTASGAWTGSEVTSGSTTVTTTAVGVSVYVLTCSGPGGSAHATVNLTVAAAAAAELSGHVGGGGALGWESLLILSILALIIRGRPMPQKPTAAFALILGAVALGSTPARAQQAGEAQPYVGLRAGQANYQYSPADLDNALGTGASGIDASISKHQFGGMIFGGMPIYRSLMLELSYVQLGQFPLSIKTTSSDNAALAQRILGQLAPAGHGVTAGFGLPLQLAPRIGLEPRLAALYYQSKQVVATGGADYRNDLRGVGIDAGLSLTYRIAGPLHVGLGADCMHMTQACNVLLYTGQIEYRFGGR